MIVFVLGCTSASRKEDRRVVLFDKLVDEIERVDGDGLIPRKNRPDSWGHVVAQLRNDIRAAKTTYEVGQVYKRLDLSYPNIHSHITLSRDYDYHQAFGRLKFPFIIRYEKVGKEKLIPKLRLKVTDKSKFLHLPASQRPISGDEITKINHRTIPDWHREVFNFCKYPQEKQCAVGFWDNFRKELYSWDRSVPLRFQLKRGDKLWEIIAPIEIPNKAQSKPRRTSKTWECPKSKPSYPGFKLAYGGYNACVYENDKIKNTVLLNIRSFNYRKDSKPTSIQNIADETSLFWNKYWKRKAPTVSHLVVDVMNNMGGSSPVKWYALFFPDEYQEQYVQFKNIRELDKASFRDALFYSEPGKEMAYAEFKSKGIINKLGEVDFLPPVQQFCGDSQRDCMNKKFRPRRNQFTGKVSIALDQWCHSSCVGFVWNMKNVLKERVKFYGHPDDGDSTYGRIHIDGGINSKKEIWVTTRPRVGGQYGSLGEGSIFTQAVSVSRSTSSDGTIVSGKVQALDHFIPIYWNDTWVNWEKRVIQKTLERM